MKKVLKFFTVCLAILSVIILGAFCFYLFATGGAVLDENKLIKSGAAITFYDNNSDKVVTTDGFDQKAIGFDELPEYVGNAFIAVEDKRFYSHNGIDPRALIRAAVSDIKSRSLKEGGSTISQQLVKNTHLSGEKTLLRKLKEVKLVNQLEKKYSKREILGFYLNGIYFGNGAYGVESAANRYFSKSASDLSLSEAAALAATVKSPANYNPETAAGKSRRNLVLKLMCEQGLISSAEYAAAKDEPLTTSAGKPCDYFSLVKEELYSVCKISPYETRPIEVYTYFDKKAQDALSSLTESDGELRKNGLIASLSGHVKAAVFPFGDDYGMPASTIKPLLVYAPAINEGVISPATLIDDSPTDFGGYTPKNYGDVYHGYTSVKDCIVKSLNVPAVKIFDGTGAEKCLAYANKTGLDITEKTLNVALGGYEKGVRFTDLCAAYTVFNGGVYYPPRFIKSVRIGRLSAYSATDNGTTVFKKGTTDLINDALKECTKTGTAKALSMFDFDLCAKTGTNGTKDGNTDALAVCYTSEDIIGVKLCAGKSILPCSVTGGTAAREAAEIIEKLYSDHKPAPLGKSDECEEVRLCKLAYEDGKLLLAPENQPDKYCIKAKFLKEFLPTEYSEEFVSPKVSAEICKNKNNVTVTLDKKTQVYVEIFRTDGKTETPVADTNDEKFTDNRLKDGRYGYYVLPYTIGLDGKKFYGEKQFVAEIFIGEKQDFADNGNWADD